MEKRIKELEKRIASLENIIYKKNNYTINESKIKLPQYIDEVINYILSNNNMTMNDLISGKNELAIQLCRHELHAILFKLFSIRSSDYVGLNYNCINLSLKSIGRITQRTHATILHSLNVIEAECFTRREYANYFNKMLETCRNITINEINITDN